MKIAILGLGYVGLTAAGCLTKQGHHVLGVDVNEAKVAQLRQGHSPIKEPGLEDLLRRALAEGLLAVDVSVENHLSDRDIAIVCVGTPSAPDGSHDMGFILEVTRQIGGALVGSSRAKPLTVAYRSTIRPGSIENLVLPALKDVLGDEIGKVEVVYNPEFLRESMAVSDFFAPPKIVVGTHDGQPSSNMTALNEGLQAPVFHTGYREAEFTKFADNSFHAVKVAFANELGRICTAMGVSARKVHEIFISDTKLNISPYYLRPGGAFGGSCLPKDVRALQHMAVETGSEASLIGSLINSNEAHKAFLFDYCTRGLKRGARVLMLGLAFKDETDDLRESPNVDLAGRLIEAGYDLSIHDPTLNPASLLGVNLTYAASHLPQLSGLLIGSKEVQEGQFDRIIDTNGRRRGMNLPQVELVDLNALR